MEEKPNEQENKQHDETVKDDGALPKGAVAALGALRALGTLGTSSLFGRGGSLVVNVHIGDKITNNHSTPISGFALGGASE